MDFEQYLRSRSWDLPRDYDDFISMFERLTGSSRPEMLAAFLMSPEVRPMPLGLLKECVAGLERAGVAVPQQALDRLKDEHKE